MNYYVILYVTLVSNALASPISITTTPRGSCHYKSVLNQTYTSALECSFLTSADEWRNHAGTIGNLSSLKFLTISHSSFRILTASSLSNLTNLEVLNITQNKKLQEVEKLPYLPTLRTLNLSNNSLTELAPESFANLPKLTKLSLAYNNLTILNGTDETGWGNVVKKLEALYLAGESLICSLYFSMNWLLKYEHILKDADLTWCTVNETESHYIDRKFPMIKLLHAIEDKRKLCPEECECPFKRTYMEGTALKYEVSVNCESKNLTKLPDTLPDFTTDLNVNNNEISDLKIVETNKNYTSLKALSVANNNLTSLQSLANGEFLKRYQFLDVSGNPIKLTELPLDALGEGNAKKAINETNQGKALILYNIMGPCDCYMAEILTPWILANFGILGANGNGEARSLQCVREGKMVMIAQLVKDLECPKAKEEWDSVYTNYTIVAVECILLLVLLLKITYDTWVYFRTGKLPWIATKIP